jgi:hypothetical protein
MASKRLLLPISGPDDEIDCDAVDAGLAIATASTEAREPERRHAPGSETASESSGASELAEEDGEEIDLRSVHSLDVRVLESPVDSSPPAIGVDDRLQQQQEGGGERGRGRLGLTYGHHHHHHHHNHYYHHANNAYGGALLHPQAMAPLETTRRSLSGPPSRTQNRLSWPLPLNLVNPLPSPAAVAAASASASFATNSSNASSSSSGGRDIFYETRRSQPAQQQQPAAYNVSPLPSPSHQHHTLHNASMPMSYPSPVNTPTPIPSSMFPRGSASGNSTQRHRNTPSTATVKPPRMRSRGPVDSAENSGGEFSAGGAGSRSSSRLSMTRPISPGAVVGEPYYRPSSSLSIDKRMIPLPPSPVPPPSPGTTAFVNAKMAGLSLSSSPSSAMHYQQQQQQQQMHRSPHHHLQHHNQHHHNLSHHHHHLLIPHRRDPTTGSTGSASPTASMYGSSSTTSESSVSASPPAPLSPAIKTTSSSPPLSLPSTHESVGVGGCGKIEAGQQVQQEQLTLQDGILGR